MISLYFAALEQADNIGGEAFNIGGGIDNSLSLLELFDLLKDLIGEPLNYSRLAPRESDQRVFVANFAKAKKLIGWEPQVCARNGVTRMLEWTTGLIGGQL